MQVEEVRIDEISNHERNPKIHNETQIRLLEKSIKKFGYTNPVILSADGVILAGHARVKAAIQMGQDTIPCIRTKLSGKDADAYLLADNRLSDIAPYDRDILAELLSDLPKDLVDITGFDTVQVDALLSGEDIPDIEKFISDSQPEEEREEVDAEPQIDRAAELNKKWQVKTGDLWQCGEHRIICGDCTDPVVVERLMQGEKADLVLTDPPYGQAYLSNRYGPNQSSPNPQGKIEGDDKPRPEMLDQYFNLLNKSGAMYVCTRWVQCADWVEYISDRLPVRNVIVWVKNNWSAGNLTGAFGFMYEQLIFAAGKGNTIRGNRDPDVWEFDRSPPTYHPTTKPVALFQKAVDKSTDVGMVVCDPFIGSGTTMIACENTGRKCRGIEISPEYCAVILQRYQDATGKEPVRIND